MKKISKLQHKLQGPNIPVSLKVQTLEVLGNSPKVPKIAAGTQPVGNSSKVPDLGIQTYKASRIMVIVSN
jgi:hypothetical protein